RHRLWRDLRAGELRQSQAQGDHRNLSAGQVPQEVISGMGEFQGMRAKPSDSKLINLFLDMLAAEQGAGDNTLQAYRRDLTDCSEFLRRAGQTFAGADTQNMRDYLAD